MPPMLLIPSAFLNMFQLRPPQPAILTNTYRSASHLFIDGTSLLSREGTTQGDPLAMPKYVISVVCHSIIDGHGQASLVC